MFWFKLLFLYLLTSDQNRTHKFSEHIRKCALHGDVEQFRVVTHLDGEVLPLIKAKREICFASSGIFVSLKLGALFLSTNRYPEKKLKVFCVEWISDQGKRWPKKFSLKCFKLHLFQMLFWDAGKQKDTDVWKHFAILYMYSQNSCLKAKVL